MKYIICMKPGEFQLKEKEAPIKVPGEALLRVKKVGICGTDLHGYAGNQAFFHYPRIFGHELAAEVVEIENNDQNIKPYDNVVVRPYITCGTCIACRNGKSNCCITLKVLGVHTDGGMQEYISVPIDLLIPAKGLNDQEIAIVEPLAIGAHAIRRARLHKGENVVVVGCGPIGIGIMKFAKIAGVKVIAIDMNEQRLQYAKQIIGVDHTISGKDNVLEKVRELTQGDLATAVFDATGHKGALESGVDYMSHGGRYILVGLAKGEITFTHPAIHAKETTLICSRNATLVDFEYVISILKKGQFPVDSFITHRVGFKEMITQFDSWLDPRNGVIKAMVDF